MYIRLDHKTTLHTNILLILLNDIIFGVEDNVVTNWELGLMMLMAKHHISTCRCLKVTPNFICFLKEANSSKTHLANEGQPTYVYLALVSILPTDQWQFVTSRYRKGWLRLTVFVCMCLCVTEKEFNADTDIPSWIHCRVLICGVFLHIDCKYISKHIKKISNHSVSSMLQSFFLKVVCLHDLWQVLGGNKVLKNKYTNKVWENKVLKKKQKNTTLP